MGWQLVNSQIRIPAGIGINNDTPETESYICKCFLKGDGNESTYFCFLNSPYISTPFISQTYWPKIYVDGASTGIPQWDASYNNAQVYGSDSGNKWVFISKSSNAWIYFDKLREPYYYTDIDEETKVGDKFYTGNMPTLNEGQAQWQIDGAYSQQEEGDTISVELKQDVWVWQENGDRRQRASGFCGKYKNEKDGSWKMVGIPVFGTYTEASGAYVKGEKFKRGSKDSNGHFVYEGTKGHTIHFEKGTWIMGTADSGKWSAGNEPSLHSGSSVDFKGYEIDEGTKQQVPDPKGDFSIKFEHCEMGNQVGTVLMAEVSLWRPKI